jgi:hypothetical protein
MKKSFLLIMMIVIRTLEITAQNPFLDKIYLKASVSTFKTISEEITLKTGLNINYSFANWIDIGIYGRYANLVNREELPYNPQTGKYEWFSANGKSRIISGTPNYDYNAKTIFYGIRSDIHLLPLLTDKNLRLDVYLTPELGFVSQEYEAHLDYVVTGWNKPVFEYGAGLGIAWYFSRHFGVFSELNYGHYFGSKTYFQTGLSIKL